MASVKPLTENRQAAIKEAANDCWDGTAEIIEAVVRESRNAGAWCPVRAGAMMTMAGPGEIHMTAEQFAIWKKQARNLAKVLGITERPIDDLTMTRDRFSDLGNPRRAERVNARVTRAEALACAHYLAGFPKPCGPDDLADWFFPRFGTFASVAPVLDFEVRAISRRINGYQIVNGERQPFVPEGSFIRALDWLWRVGPVNPYGTRPTLAFWPGQDLIER